MLFLVSCSGCYLLIWDRVQAGCLHSARGMYLSVRVCVLRVRQQG